MTQGMKINNVQRGIILEYEDKKTHQMYNKNGGQLHLISLVNH